MDEDAIVHGYFCLNMMLNFTLQFSFHFGKKTFWWDRRVNISAPLFILFLLYSSKHISKSFPSYFLSKVFRSPYFIFKQIHNYGKKKKKKNPQELRMVIGLNFLNEFSKKLNIVKKKKKEKNFWSPQCIESKFSKSLEPHLRYKIQII